MGNTEFISSQRVKYIHSLQLKKYRQKYSHFVVEGEKSIKELVESDLKVVQLVVLKGTDFDLPIDNVVFAEPVQMKKMTSLKSFSPFLAVVEMPKYPFPPKGKWFIACDGLRDPGNLGTIIRIADWYGIDAVVCSEDTVDAYNPKTLSSTMGSFTRIPVYHLDLEAFLKDSKLPVLGCFMEGESVYDIDQGTGIILIGSESHGIRERVENLCTKRITIPRMGNAESLNASVAAGIICDRLLGEK